jgi:hypothetical protein
MIPMSMPAEPTGAAGRCTECGARVRPDDRWCTLCHTPVAVPVPPAVPAHATPEPAARLADESVAGPVDAASEAASEARDEAAARAAEAAERMLAELRVGEARRLSPRLAAIRPRSKAAEAALACVGGLVMVGVLFGVLYVVGRLL